jgi:hypothetical protein
MQFLRQSLARHPAVAAMRLACAVLVALWALATVPLPTLGTPSLTKPAREYAMLAAKRPATAVAELATSRAAKHQAGPADHPGLVGMALRQRRFAPSIAAFDAGPGVAGEPRSANLARAPPSPGAA